MRRLLLASLLLVACRQIAGIHDITFEGGTGGDGGGNLCTGGTPVLTSSESLDILMVAGGNAMAATLSAQGSNFANVLSCPTGSSCTNPPGILSLSFSQSMSSYAASSLVYYAIAGNSGSIHSAGLDGKNDQVLLATATSPLWLGVTGTKVFWTSDDGGTTPASLHCIGCGAGDQTWITNLGLTAGVVADASTVYVIADDGSNNLTDAIYSCPTSAACGSAPKKLIAGLTFNALYVAAQVATDGTYVYVTNDQSAIIRIDASGTQKTVLQGVTAAVIAVDSATGDLFYGTDNGTIAKVKSDGSAAPVTLSTCAPGDANAVTGIAFDATNVYVLVVPTSTNAQGVYAIKRN